MAPSADSVRPQEGTEGDREWRNALRTQIERGAEATPLRTGHLVEKSPDAKARMQEFMRERYRD